MQVAVSKMGVSDSNVGVSASNLGALVSNIVALVSNMGLPVSSTGLPVFNMGLPVSNMCVPIRKFEVPVPNIKVPSRKSEVPSGKIKVQGACPTTLDHQIQIGCFEFHQCSWWLFIPCLNKKTHRASAIKTVGCPELRFAFALFKSGFAKAPFSVNSSLEIVTPEPRVAVGSCVGHPTSTPRDEASKGYACHKLSTKCSLWLWLHHPKWPLLIAADVR